MHHHSLLSITIMFMAKVIKENNRKGIILHGKILRIFKIGNITKQIVYSI